MIMPRYRSRNYLRPVNTIKHVNTDQGGVTAATKTAVAIADTVDAPVLANSQEVITGSNVKSFFLDIKGVSTGGAGVLSNLFLMVYKNPGNNVPTASIPAANAVGVSDFKKMVFHQEMIMGNQIPDSQPQTIFKGVLKVPRHMQRMGADDVIGFQLYSPGVTWDYCSQSIFKEIR